MALERKCNEGSGSGTTSDCRADVPGEGYVFTSLCIRNPPAFAFPPPVQLEVSPLLNSGHARRDHDQPQEAASVRGSGVGMGAGVGG